MANFFIRTFEGSEPKIIDDLNAGDQTQADHRAEASSSRPEPFTVPVTFSFKDGPSDETSRSSTAELCTRPSHLHTAGEAATDVTESGADARIRKSGRG